MAATPTRQKTLNNIRNHSIHTLSTEILQLLKQTEIILDKQYNLTKISARNMKCNTIEHVDTCSTNSTDIISNNKYHRHNTSINTRKGRLNPT